MGGMCQEGFRVLGTSLLIFDLAPWGIDPRFGVLLVKFTVAHALKLWLPLQRFCSGRI